jgi:hypothetical protein
MHIVQRTRNNACYSFATPETLIYRRLFLLLLCNDPTNVNLLLRCDEHQSARDKLIYWCFFHLLTDSSSELHRCSFQLFFDPEDGGDTFLRNVGYNSTDYTASYPRR